MWRVVLGDHDVDRLSQFLEVETGPGVELTLNDQGHLHITGVARGNSKIISSIRIPMAKVVVG